MPEMAPESDLRQLQTARRSVVVLAALLRDLIPLQHPPGGVGTLPVAYGMQEDSELVTVPQVMAASAT